MTRPILPDSDTAPSRWRWRRLLLLGLLVVAGLAAGGGWLLVSMKNRQLQAALAEADQLDPGWRLEDLDAKRPVIPDDENSALTLIAAYQKMPPKWPEWDIPLQPPESLPDPDEEDLPPAEALPAPRQEEIPPPERLPPPREEDFPPGEDPDLGEGEMPNARGSDDPLEEARRQFADAFGTLYPPVRFNEEQERRLRAEMKRAADALAVARTLVRQPRGRHPITVSMDWNSTLITTVQDSRGVVQLLALDARLRAHDGDLEGALASCHAIFNAGSSLRDEPATICMIVHIVFRSVAVALVERVLAQGEVGDDALAALQGRLEEEAALPLLLVAVRGERAGWDRFLAAVQKGELKVSDVRDLGSSGGRGEWFDDYTRLHVPGAVASARAVVLRKMNQAVEIAKLPPEEQRARIDEWDASLRKESTLVHCLCLGSMLIPRHVWSDGARARCAAVGVAVERYRRRHRRWPDALSDLTPQFLKAVPADPFDGQPLRYRKDEEGAVVYSVGPDGKDDGGAFDKLDGRQPGSDLGFRLWEPALRGQRP